MITVSNISKISNSGSVSAHIKSFVIPANTGVYRLDRVYFNINDARSAWDLSSRAMFLAQCLAGRDTPSTGSIDRQGININETASLGAWHLHNSDYGTPLDLRFIAAFQAAINSNSKFVIFWSAGTTAAMENYVRSVQSTNPILWLFLNVYPAETNNFYTDTLPMIW